MWCVNGVWVVMRAGVQASGGMIVWVVRGCVQLVLCMGCGRRLGCLGLLCVECVGRQQV